MSAVPGLQQPTAAAMSPYVAAAANGQADLSAVNMLTLQQILAATAGAAGQPVSQAAAVAGQALTSNGNGTATGYQQIIT